ncbi:MAG: hypothetical protein QXJ06_00030 [Candidatus Aenigmatarchaeota archaeon]
MFNSIKLFALLLLLLPTAYSLEQINVSFSGYGKTTNEVLLTVHNTGDQNLKGLLVYVDNKEYEKNPDVLLEPKQGFELLLFLEPDQHEIYVAVGNAEKTITLNVPEKAEYKEEVSMAKENKTMLMAIIIVIIVAILAFLLLNKRRLFLI